MPPNQLSMSKKPITSPCAWIWRHCAAQNTSTITAPAALLGGGLLHLPVDGRDRRLKAHAADNLLESGVVAAETRRALSMTRGESSRFSLVSLRRPSAARDAALKKQRVDMRFLRAMATLFDRVAGLDLDRGANIAPAVRAREIMTRTLIDPCNDPSQIFPG